MWKFANKKVAAKKSVKNQRFSSSILLTCKSVWQITFSGWIFFQLFSQIWNQRKILHILNTHMPKKNKKIFGIIEYIYDYMLELVKCKFARNGFTNWKTSLTNIFENIIWHLFAGESHQVVNITVPCPHMGDIFHEQFCCLWMAISYTTYRTKPPFSSVFSNIS